MIKQKAPAIHLPEKVQCQMNGCHHEAHILIEHLKVKHGIENPAAEYAVKYDAPLWSSYGLQKIKEQHQDDPDVAMVPRPRESMAIKELFPDLAKDKELSDKAKFKVFSTATERTPPVDPNFVFLKEPLLAFLTFMERKDRNRIWIAGQTGTGKTQFVRNVCGKIKADMWRLPCDAHQKRADIIGTWTLRGNDMVFQYGILPQAMMSGSVLVLDEFDTFTPLLANIFKSVCEDYPTLVIPEYGGKPVKAHPDFRVVVTANTFGRGDDSGLYVSTMTQSRADMRRFNCFIEMPYLPEEKEVELILKHTEKYDVTEKEARGFVSVAKDIRAATKAGRIDVPFSVDELLNWVLTWLAVANVKEAASLCFLNACPEDVRVAVMAMIDTYFTDEDDVRDPNQAVQP